MHLRMNVQETEIVCLSLEQLVNFYTNKASQWHTHIKDFDAMDKVTNDIDPIWEKLKVWFVDKKGPKIEKIKIALTDFDSKAITSEIEYFSNDIEILRIKVWTCSRRWAMKKDIASLLLKSFQRKLAFITA